MALRAHKAGDRERTAMQRDGRLTLTNNTLADLVRVCNDLGIDPEQVVVRGTVDARGPVEFDARSKHWTGT